MDLKACACLKLNIFCKMPNIFQSGLGPQHLVHHHPQYVCSIMFGRPPPSPAPSRPHLPHPGLSTPPPERHSFCLLCGQRFLKKHVKLLALHLQQQHPKKFSQVMDTYFVSENKTSLEPKQVKVKLHHKYVLWIPEQKPNLDPFISFLAALH